jgi:hypothetical protein
VLAAGAVCGLLAVTTSPLELLVRFDGDFLRISAPRLDFLSGKALDRLKDGLSVAYVGQLTISLSPNSVVPDARAVAEFAVSRDIWEEKFTVTKIGDRPETRRNSVSHLSAKAAETWCLDNLAIDPGAIPADRPFFVHLDLRTEDPHDQLGIVGDSGISISRLIEVFSRPAKGVQSWPLNAGPFRLADLKKAGRG